MLDVTVYERQEKWEDSPEGWPQGYKTDGDQFRTEGRPNPQWAWLAAGHDGDLGSSTASGSKNHCD